MPKKSKPRLDVEEEPMLSGMATSSGPGTNGFIANGSMGAAAFGSLPDIQAIAERGPRARPVIHSAQSLGEVELGRTDTAGQASDTEQGEGGGPPEPLPPPLLNAALHFTNDHLDKYMPTVLNVFTWAWGTLSLFLHFIAVFTTAAIALVLHHNGHRVFAAAIACLYLLSHYLMAVIMYMEQDRVARAGRYNLSEFSVFAQRLVDVALYDIQLLASLVHSNTMIEGLTQMLLKGYQQQIWIALVFSVLNALEKWLRLSLADPWLHPRNDDRYPLLYMRSNASRLPRGLMMDWLFR
ncbi:uncharacterized protein HaLaN_10517 [Haematococcus lacustris]|uniref:Uncharacterized protein n=1 Tax=Haematococcus lacustris TaxID=44745 RepID=A0A699Z5A0_HAELA|nr:uncharacterized protein HaLaN_10517 [Haematococcus lacustris]